MVYMYIYRDERENTMSDTIETNKEHKETMETLRKLTAPVDLNKIYSDAQLIAEATVINFYNQVKVKGIPLDVAKMHESNIFSMAYTEYAVSCGLNDDDQLKKQIQKALNIR